MVGLHCLEEDVLERVLLAAQAPDLDLRRVGEPVEVADLDALGENHLEPPSVLPCVLAAEPPHGFGERSVVAARLDLEEPPVRAALLFEVAVHRDAALLQDQDLLAA